MLTDQRGAPLAVVVTAANRHDLTAAVTTLESLVVKRPVPKPYHPQHLCLDKAYDAAELEQAVRARQYRPHIRRRGEPAPTPNKRRYKARRWVVDRTHSWHNRFRKLAVRWEKKCKTILG